MHWKIFEFDDYVCYKVTLEVYYPGIWKMKLKKIQKCFRLWVELLEWQIDLQLQNKSSHSPVGQRQFDGPDDYEN